MEEKILVVDDGEPNPGLETPLESGQSEVPPEPVGMPGPDPNRAKVRLIPWQVGMPILLDKSDITFAIHGHVFRVAKVWTSHSPFPQATIEEVGLVGIEQSPEEAFNRMPYSQQPPPPTEGERALLVKPSSGE